MLYALVGVPLMLMCLSSLGGLLANALQCSYGKMCGRGQQKTCDDDGHEFEEVCFKILLLNLNDKILVGETDLMSLIYFNYLITD